MPKIERNIPIPPVRRREAVKYPLPRLKPGESMFFKEEDVAGINLRAKQCMIAQMAHHMGRTHGRLFTVRSVEGGFRVWRLA